MSSEIRKDYFLPNYVIITPGREKRPRLMKIENNSQEQKKCPFCVEGIEKNLIVKSYGPKKNWKAMVIKNKFPAVELNNPRAYGEHEVIIETPEHGKELSELSLKQIELLFSIWQERTKTLSKIKNIEYILIFKNQGGKAGASIAHSHMQIFATNILPPDILEESNLSHKFLKEQGVCPYCQILSQEEKSQRKIASDKYTVAFAPYASKYHYEAWIFPRRHIDNVLYLKKTEINSMAKILKNILKKVFRLGFSYNFFLHQLIRDTNQHFYIKIQPREAVWGGVELGSGIVINSVAPEKAAAYYRK